MNLITLDFETYYGKGLGFRSQTTEEYIKDPRFEVIGVGVKLNDESAEWFTGTHDEVRNYLKKFDWKNSHLLCHNTLFDGSILAWHFGIVPKVYLDTLCMARAIYGVDAGGSLKVLAEKHGIGVKGTEVEDAEGLRRQDFTEEHLAIYGEYCKNDVELTHRLWEDLSKHFPEDELSLIDMTLRMFINPIFMLDDAMLLERLEDLKQEERIPMRSRKTTLRSSNSRITKTPSSSNCVQLDLALNRLLKSHGLSGFYQLDAEIKEGYRFHLSIMGHIRVVGLVPTRLISKTFHRVTRRKKHSKMQLLLPRATLLSTATQAKSKPAF